jgi:hypothetical protein
MLRFRHLGEGGVWFNDESALATVGHDARVEV